jgi:polysaccharide export outer membrane protein
MHMPHFFSRIVRAFSNLARLSKCCVAAAVLIVACSILCLGQSPHQSSTPAAATALNGGMSDDPITAGETVHINVFQAPDFSMTTRVSENGEIAFPILGAIRIVGLSSTEAGALIASQLRNHDLMLDPQVMVTVDSTSTSITILGEVHAPGEYPPPGKGLLSDALAAAGGMTTNTGRVIEVSNHRTPENKTYIPWDPTMHNTSGYDLPVHAGDRILVRACGLAYVGGNVARPGAYPLCGSPKMTLSEVISLAGGISPLSATDHTMIVRSHPDGTKVAVQVDAKKILLSKAADVVVQEDDVIYVPASGVKNAAQRALTFSLTLVAPLLYLYR